VALTSGGTSDISLTSAADVVVTAAGDIDLDVGGGVTITQGALLSFDGTTDQNEAISSDGTALNVMAGGDINLVPSGVGHVTIPRSRKLVFDGTTDDAEYISSGAS
jgi:hypothetical protein